MKSKKTSKGCISAGQLARDTRGNGQSGFTLIELLVVIAIIAILISILLPALSAARRHSQATKCSANLHHVGQAMSGYLVDSSGVYPPAYIYPLDGGVDYDLNAQGDQGSTNPTYGYLHWSYFLYGNGQAGDDAFRCPSIPNGGAPRTNPGSSPLEWEPGQADQNGQSAPNPFQDRQASRIAYAGNAAVFPRNKFTPDMSGGPRVNRCVNEKEFGSGSTILVAELAKNWKTISQGSEGSYLCKSHRPINPFINIASGTNEYQSSPNTPGFTYGQEPNYGLVPAGDHDGLTGIVDGGSTVETNAVGRHHPGGGGYVGGTGNFLYADTHVEKKTVLETVQRWEWGTKFYSLTGNTKIGPPW